MIRTPRSAALAVLAAVAAAALVSLPGTAFADASGLGAGPGPGFNNGIVVHNFYQFAGGDISNTDDGDGIIENPPGAGVPFAQFQIANHASSALRLVSQQGADYPPFLNSQSAGFVQASGPSTADYQSAGAPGSVHIDATQESQPTCSGNGSLQCHVEFSPAGVQLVVTG